MSPRLTSTTLSAVVDRCRGWLAKEALPPGTALPPSRELARDWGVHFTTVSRALRELVVRGEVRREGKRHVVPDPGSQPPKPLPSPPGTGPTLVFLSLLAEFIPVVREIAVHHGYALDAEVIRDPSLHAGHLIRRFEAGARAFLLFGYSGPDDLIQRMEAAGAVIVMIDPGAVEGTSCLASSFSVASRRAVEHLTALGHREIGYIGLPPIIFHRAEIERGYRSGCLMGELLTSARRVMHVARNRTIVRLPASWLGPRRRITGVVCGDYRLIPALMAGLRKGGLQVPTDISVISCDDGDACVHASPAVTALRVERREIARLGALLVFERLRRSLIKGTAPLPPVEVELMPQLRKRHSCAALPGADEEKAPPQPRSAPPAPDGLQRFLRPPAERRRWAESTWLDNYAHAESVAPEDWTPLPLKRWLNRSINRQNAWFGSDPLKHLDTGTHVIHGVPFIIDSRQRQPAAIVLRRHQRGNRKGVPARVRIPVRRHVSALYVLHACGTATEPDKPIATYRIWLSDGTVSEIPLVPLRPKSIEVRGTPSKTHGNIQDWWPDHEPARTPGARPVVITQGGDPAAYARYLYTLEWRAPTGGAFVESWDVQLAPGTTASLAILAATACTREDS